MVFVTIIPSQGEKGFTHGIIFVNQEIPSVTIPRSAYGGHGTHNLQKGGSLMNEIDRDVALALLKRLYLRDFISEKTLLSAQNSRFLDKKRFAHCTPTGESAVHG